MLHNDKILNPGDILVDSLTIQSAAGATLDVKSQFVSINIYEDIFANGLSGFLVLIDSINLLRYLQITGRETLKIVFSTPGDTENNDFVEKTFKIYKMTSETKLSGEGKKLVRLEFVSVPTYENAKLKISRSFTDMPYSEMVERIGNDVFGMSINCCPTSGRRNVVIPNWNPMYAINWLAKRSFAESMPEACDYVFFESLDGKYQFVPLTLLKAQDAIVKYHHTPTNRDQTTGEIFMKKEFYNIISFSVGGRGDKMREVVSGVYANNALALDILGKKASTQLYTYFTQRSRVPTISKYPLISKVTDDLSYNVTAYQKYYPKHSFRYDSVEDNDELEIVSTRRQSQMNQFRTNTLMITVNGDSRRRVGDIVSVDIPSTEDPKNKDDWYDPYLSGRYMVTSILHEIGDGSYNMKMELVKDGYDEKIPEVQTFDSGDI
jgi:hypothetical protein